MINAAHGARIWQRCRVLFGHQRHSASRLQYYFRGQFTSIIFDAASIRTSNHLGHIRFSSDNIRLESSIDLPDTGLVGRPWLRPTFDRPSPIPCLFYGFQFRTGKMTNSGSQWNWLFNGNKPHHPRASCVTICSVGLEWIQRMSI